MTTPFTRPYNQVGFTLSQPYAPGDAQVHLESLAGLPSNRPDSTHPIRLSLIRKRDGARSIVIAQGRSGTTLTSVAVAEGKTDLPFDVGDAAVMQLSAGYVADLQDAVNALEAGGGGGGGGATLSFTAANVDSVSLGAGCPAAINTNGIGVLQASAANNARATIGLVQSSTSPAAAATVVTVGLFALGDWTALIGAANLASRGIYYLSATPGLLTVTPPSTPGQVVQRVGVAVSPTTLDLEIMPPILL